MNLPPMAMRMALDKLRTDYKPDEARKVAANVAAQFPGDVPNILRVLHDLTEAFEEVAAVPAGMDPNR